MTQYAVNGRYEHLYHFIKGNGVLPLGQVGISQQEENGFNAGRNGLLDACSVPHFGVDVVVDIGVVGRVGGMASFV